MHTYQHARLSATHTRTRACVSVSACVLEGEYSKEHCETTWSQWYNLHTHRVFLKPKAFLPPPQLNTILLPHPSTLVYTNLCRNFQEWSSISNTTH